MKRILLAILTLLVQAPSLHAYNCKARVEVLDGSVRSLRFAQLVEISGAGREPTRAHFIGEDEKFYYFARENSLAVVKTAKRRTVFPKTPRILVNAQIVKGDDRGTNSCATHSTMACLSILDTKGLVSHEFSKQLHSNWDEVFEEIANRVSKFNRHDEASFIEQFDRQETHEGKFEVAKRWRRAQHAEIEKVLKEVGVRSHYTSSVDELIRHLKSGRPAYISTHAIKMSRPLLTEDLSKPKRLAENDYRPSQTYPHPPLENLMRADFGDPFPHAVAAFGVLPGEGAGGQRIVVKDSTGNTVGLWLEDDLRTSQARFILMGASESSRVVESLEADVRLYYKQIDGGNVAGALERFGNSGMYVRGELNMNGMEEIGHFYQHGRDLIGKHTVTQIVTDERFGQVRVEGTFTGHSGGRRVQLLFTDVWGYDLRTNRVEFRESTVRDRSVDQPR